MILAVIVALLVVYVTLLVIAASDLVNMFDRGGKVILPDWLFGVVMAPLAGVAWVWRHVAESAKTILQTITMAMALFAAMAIGFQLGRPEPATVVTGPFRPWPKPGPTPPRPPEPPSPPLTEDDDRLVRRLLPRLRDIADERASARIAAEFKAAADQIARGEDGPIVVEYGDDPEHLTQGVMGIMLASAIAAGVKKIVVGLVMAVVGTAILALAVKYWTWLAGGAVLVITVIAWPAGWAAGKWAKP